MLEASLTAKKETTVTEEMTAARMGSGRLPVYATPSLVAFMEEVCVACVEDQMEPGMTTVGISLNLTHTAATPVGMKVTCECTLTEVDGRKLTFDVRACDERSVIGHCIHERMVVSMDRFMEKTTAKLQ